MINDSSCAGADFSPASLRQALQELCAASSLSGADVSARLGVGYSTVASWRLTSRGGKAPKNLPSRSNCDRIRVAFPELEKLSQKSPPASNTERLLPRRRDLKSEPWWSDAATLASSQVADLCNGIWVAAIENQMAMPYLAEDIRRPAEMVARLRELTGLGVGPVGDVVYAIERLLIPVVHVPFGNTRWVTLVHRSSNESPAILYGPSNAQSNDIRHALLVELGFHLIGKATRASAKHHAAFQFADEFLVPATTLTRILVNKRPVLSPEIDYISGLFGVPVAAVERQCSRIGCKADTSSKSQTSPVSSFLGLLRSRTTARAFHEMPPEVKPASVEGTSE